MSLRGLFSRDAATKRLCMKIYRNVPIIEGKERYGRRLSMAGLVILLIGLVVNFTPTWYPPDAAPPNALAAFLQQYWTYISLASLALGFLLASMGSYYINRFARRRWPGSKNFERPDEVLQRSLKGFDDRYGYFAYSLPTPYTLVGPFGILLLATRSDRGRVVVSGEKWREPFSLSRIFTVFAREGVGNPAKDLADQADKIRALLATADADQQELFSKVPIEGAAVFLNPDVTLELDNPSVPALRADQLKDYLRRRGKELKLDQATLRALTSFLVEQAEFPTE